MTPGPQFAAIIAGRLLHLLGLCGPYPGYPEAEQVAAAHGLPVPMHEHGETATTT